MEWDDGGAAGDDEAGEGDRAERAPFPPPNKLAVAITGLAGTMEQCRQRRGKGMGKEHYNGVSAMGCLANDIFIFHFSN